MPISSTTRNYILAAHAACEEKKALNARILELDPAESAFTDAFLICSGANPRQVQAIADEVELRLKREFGMYANSVEGYRTAKWILLDYVDFVVHVFDEETRALYDIERLRKTANAVSLEAWKRPLVAKVAAVRAAGGKPKTAAKKKAVAKKNAGKKSTAAGRGKASGAKKVAAKRTTSKAGKASRPSQRTTPKKKAAKKTATTRTSARSSQRGKAAKPAAKRTGKKKTTR